MFEAAVDGFGGAIAGVGVVEVGQDVCGSAFECPAQRDELGQTSRYARSLSIFLCMGVRGRG